MSSIGSTALQTMKQKTQKRPDVPSPTPKQQQFNRGTMNLLDEARRVAENAVGQGQQLNPMIYQMLGLEPEYEDNTPHLQAAQDEMNAAQQQWAEAQQTEARLRGIPKGQRSKEQRRQLKALKKASPGLETAAAKTRDAFGSLQTTAKTITGFKRLAPENIPAESPFSARNPLFQAQRTESERLNQYLAGGEVDPTLKQQYVQAEASLRAKLSQRFGPDYENSSVGQTALQNFDRSRNEAFATWNQQQVEKYNNLAFQGEANLQNLLGGRIGLMREPSRETAAEGTNLSNAAQARLAQQQTVNQWLLGRGGVTTSTSGFPVAAAAAGGGQLLNTLLQPTTTPSGQPGPSLASQGWQGVKGGASDLYNWAVGDQALANSAAAVDAGYGGGAAAGGSLAADAAAVDAAGAAAL